jgi:hypothetical protein
MKILSAVLEFLHAHAQTDWESLTDNVKVTKFLKKKQEIERKEDRRREMQRIQVTYSKYAPDFIPIGSLFYVTKIT